MLVPSLDESVLCPAVGHLQVDDGDDNYDSDFYLKIQIYNITTYTITLYSQS